MIARLGRLNTTLLYARLTEMVVARFPDVLVWVLMLFAPLTFVVLMVQLIPAMYLLIMIFGNLP